MNRSKIKSRVASVHRSSGCLFQKSLVTVIGILFNIINTENFTRDLQGMINGSNWSKILNSYVTLLLIIDVGVWDIYRNFQYCLFPSHYSCQLMIHPMNDIPRHLAIKVINFVIFILTMTLSIRVVKNFFCYLQRVA